MPPQNVVQTAKTTVGNMKKQLLEKGEELHRSRQELRDLAQEAMQSDDIRLTAALQQAQSLEAQLKAARDEAEKANLALLERERNEVEQDTTTAAPEPQVTPTLDAAAEHLPDFEELVEIDRLMSRVQHAEEVSHAATVDRQGLHAEIAELREKLEEAAPARREDVQQGTPVGEGEVLQDGWKEGAECISVKLEPLMGQQRRETDLARKHLKSAILELSAKQGTMWDKQWEAVGQKQALEMDRLVQEREACDETLRRVSQMVEVLRVEPRRMADRFEYQIAVADMQHQEETKALRKLLALSQSEISGGNGQVGSPLPEDEKDWRIAQLEAEVSMLAHEMSELLYRLSISERSLGGEQGPNTVSPAARAKPDWAQGSEPTSFRRGHQAPSLSPSHTDTQRKQLEEVIGSLQRELAVSDATVVAMGGTIEGDMGLRRELAVSDATVVAMGGTIEGAIGLESESLRGEISRLQLECSQLGQHNEILKQEASGARSHNMERDGLQDEVASLSLEVASLTEAHRQQSEALLEAETAVKLAGNAMGDQAIFLDEAETAAKLAGNAMAERPEVSKVGSMETALEVVGALRLWHDDATSIVQPAGRVTGEEAELEQAAFVYWRRITQSTSKVSIMREELARITTHYEARLLEQSQKLSEAHDDTIHAQGEAAVLREEKEELHEIFTAGTSLELDEAHTEAHELREKLHAAERAADAALVEAKQLRERHTELATRYGRERASTWERDERERSTDAERGMGQGEESDADVLALKHEVDELQKSLKSSCASQAKIEGDNHVLREARLRSREEALEAKHEAARLLEKLGAAEAAADQFQTEGVRQTAAFAQAEQQLVISATELELAQQLALDAQQEVMALTHEMETRAEVVEFAAQEYSQLEGADLARLKDMLSRAVDEIARADRAVTAAETEDASLSGSVAELTTQKETLFAEREALQREVAGMRRELDQLTRQAKESHRGAQEGFARDLGVVEAERESLETQLHALRTEMRSTQDSKAGEVLKLTQQCTMLQERNVALVEGKAPLQRGLQEFKPQGPNPLQDIEQSQHGEISPLKELQLSADKLASFVLEAQNKEAELRRVQSELNELQEHQDKSHREASTYKNEIASLSTEMSDLERQSTALKSENEELRGKNAALQKELAIANSVSFPKGGDAADSKQVVGELEFLRGEKRSWNAINEARDRKLQSLYDDIRQQQDSVAYWKAKAGAGGATALSLNPTSPQEAQTPKPVQPSGSTPERGAPNNMPIEMLQPEPKPVLIKPTAGEWELLAPSSPGKGKPRKVAVGKGGKGNHSPDPEMSDPLSFFNMPASVPESLIAVSALRQSFFVHSYAKLPCIPLMTHRSLRRH